MKEIYLAGGCFWGLEKYISLIPGVVYTEVGYANGRTENPTYEEVKYENTGHAETVLVRYLPETLDLPTLLMRFFEVIDPTAINRQGEDEGTQYRTGIYYTDKADQEIIEAALIALQTQLEEQVQIEAGLLRDYTSAEAYHQKYLDKNPGGYCHIGSEQFQRLQKLAKKV